MRPASFLAAASAALCLLAAPLQAQDYAAQLKEGDVALRDFRFASGERIESLRIHYATLGTPRRDARGEIANAVMVLHGTGALGASSSRPSSQTNCSAPASRSI